MTRVSIVSFEISDKRKTVRTMAIPALIVLIVSILAQLLRYPYIEMQFDKHQSRLSWYMESFIKANNDYLKKIAKKIDTTTPDAGLLSQLQSEILLSAQNVKSPKRFIWMTDVKDDFLFGLPKDDFTQLNNQYKKYYDVIKKDDFYKSKNEFISKLIDNQAHLDYSHFEKEDAKEGYWGNDNARFYKPSGGWNYIRPITSTFTTPVYDKSGKYIGVLNMKVNDKANEEKYFGKHSFLDNDFFDTLINVTNVTLVLSLLFLWFLLPTWIYIDAELRNVKKPLNWVLLSAVTFVFGLVIYIVTRPSAVKTFFCPACTGELNGSTTFCPHCGYDLTSAFCRQCSYPLKEGWKFCPECRTEIKPE